MLPPSLPEDLLPFIISLLHHSRKGLRDSLSTDAFSRAIQQPVLLSLEKHTPLPFICLPSLLRVARRSLGWGCTLCPSRIQVLSAYERHLGAPRHRAFWGYHFILLPSLCAKLKQCVVLACFILLKKSPSLPCPYVFNVYINSYLNSKLEILFTLIFLFSQKSA